MCVSCLSQSEDTEPKKDEKASEWRKLLNMFHNLHVVLEMQVDDHSLHDNNEPCHGSVGVVMAHPVL
jgi:hypothetical protein